MKHSCHCGFEQRCRNFRKRKLGKLGVVLLCLHLLYHVAECLVLPTIVVGIGKCFLGQNSELATPEQAERILVMSKMRFLWVTNLEGSGGLNFARRQVFLNEFDRGSGCVASLVREQCDLAYLKLRSSTIGDEADLGEK